MADAIMRTLVRLFFTHRNLLEWVTAAQAKHAVDLKLYGILRAHVGRRRAGVRRAVAVAVARPQALSAAIPFVALWIASPAVADWISLSSPARGQSRCRRQTRKLFVRSSRRTWRFFETFVTAEDHFLPPDNFQEDPKPVVAHRTSPTNIGLYLLSTLAARDFGWIGARKRPNDWKPRCRP